MVDLLKLTHCNVGPGSFLEVTKILPLLTGLRSMMRMGLRSMLWPYHC